MKAAEIRDTIKKLLGAEVVAMTGSRVRWVVQAYKGDAVLARFVSQTPMTERQALTEALTAFQAGAR